jgi:hypothetical protein
MGDNQVVQTYLFLAGILTILVGAAHTIIAEIKIFQPMRVSGIVPTNGKPTLKERHLRIIWASWHVLTVFGWAFAAILLRMAFTYNQTELQRFVLKTLIVAMVTGALLVFYGTKAKHPGWIGLSLVALLTWLGLMFSAN